MSTKSSSSKPKQKQKQKQKQKTWTAKPKPKRVNTAPVAINVTKQTSAASIISNGNKSRRVKHTEMIGDLAGSVAFAVNKYEVNPGIVATFPWLSTLAKEWEQYRFHKLTFTYANRCSTATKGSVIIAPDYDPSDPAPTTEMAVTSYRDAISASSWKECSSILDPDAMYPLGPRKYVRINNVPGSKKVYDAANVYFCTADQADTTVIGKVFVTYDIEFFIPQTVGALEPTAVSVYSFTADTNIATGVETIIPWTVVAGTSISGEPVAGAITPAKGCYSLTGTVSAKSDNAAAFYVVARLFADGDVLPTMIASTFHTTNGANQFFTTPFAFYINEALGTTAYTIRVTLTSAGGTLTLTYGGTILVVSPI